VIASFHGTDAQTHDAFQAWRQANPDAFNLTAKSDKVFVAHRSQDKRENAQGRGCIHQGGSGNGYRESRNGCYTTAKKVCSESLEELREWAAQQASTTRDCMHCNTKKFPFTQASPTAQAHAASA
jgi:hypothetical protein